MAEPSMGDLQAPPAPDTTTPAESDLEGESNNKAEKGTEEGLEGDKEKGAEDPALAEYKQAADQMEEITRLVDAQMRDIESTKKRLAELRAQMGIKDADDSAVAAREAELSAVQQKAEQLGVAMASLEGNALGLPEELPDGESEEEMRVLQQAKDLEQESRQALSPEGEDDKEAQKKWRKEAVESFIEEASKDVVQHFSSYIEDCENKEQAQNYMPHKIASWIRIAAEEYIENGGEPNYGFEATIKTQKIDKADGGEKSYVVGFEIKLHNPEAQQEVKQDDKKDEDKMVGEEEQEELTSADKKGDLEEEEQK